jgi:hypothetical protein
MPEFFKFSFEVAGGTNEQWINLDEVCTVFVQRDTTGELAEVVFRFGPDEGRTVQLGKGQGAKEALEAFEAHLHHR